MSLKCQNTNVEVFLINMESDTDHFESADEEFASDNEEYKQSIAAERTPHAEVERLSLKNITTNICSNIQENTNANVNKPEKLRKERPQRNREPKSKLGAKLGTKIEKTTPVDLLGDWQDDWTSEKTTKNELNMYSEKFQPDKNFWEKEENYMEIPQSENKNESSWGSWGNWGSSLLSSAQLGVSTITSSVSSVLESGIGVPNPEELAKFDKNVKTEEIETQQGFGLSNLVSDITKLVETTGSKVLTGGLDTLEVIGKKTMEVLQEGDPGLKKKRALFKIDQDKPVLSHILREAKERAEQVQQISRKPHYETIFDDYQGLVHLEALEMLSKQCDIKLETLLESLNGNALQDMQETMGQIKDLCEIPEEEDEPIDIKTVEEKLESAVKDLNIPINYASFINTWKEIDACVLENEGEIHQKAIESLAQLTAIAVEQFHKAGELLLIKERRSTVDEADSLVQLTVVLTGVISHVAAKYSEKLNASNSEQITNIYFEAGNSVTYIQNAFNLMVPVLQVGAV